MFCFRWSICLTADCGVEETREKQTIKCVPISSVCELHQSNRKYSCLFTENYWCFVVSLCCDSTTPNLGVSVAISVLWQPNLGVFVGVNVLWQPNLGVFVGVNVLWQPNTQPWCFCGCQCVVTAKHPTLVFLGVSVCSDSQTSNLEVCVGVAVLWQPNFGVFCWPGSVCCDTAHAKVKDRAARIQSNR